MEYIFDFGDNAIYFWQALLRTSKLRGEAWNRFLESVFLQRLIFSSVLIRHFLFIGDLRGSKKYREILSPLGRENMVKGGEGVEVEIPINTLKTLSSWIRCCHETLNRINYILVNLKDESKVN